jgi:acyl-CoA synthetase (AMP-forming)/AMP-acid ligase II
VSYNLSELFERVADAVPEREAFVQGSRRLTFAALEERATRLANHLRSAGVGPGQHVGLLLMNGSEYLEGMLAAYKLRASAINVNYRYVEGELRYLFDDADLVALVTHRRFLPRVAAIVSELPKLQHILVVEDGSAESADLEGVGYEAALAAASAERDFPGRTSDDVYVIYTGGTTGMPKGVMWRHEDIFFSAMGGGDPAGAGNPLKSPDDIASRVLPQSMAVLAAPPLMHAAAQWSAFTQLYGGGKVVVTEGGFDPDAVWEAVGREQVAVVTIVGDAMGTPLADALEASPSRFDTSSLLALASGGALFSPSTKERFLSLLPGCMIIDTVGSSETGVMANSLQTSDSAPTGDQRFGINDQTQVFGDDKQPVVPGSGQVGMLARKARVPIGYYNDETKSRTTFLDIKGERWALPGDMAMVEADGSITLLGRGSVSINTGGEKVFPEEVELALKAHPQIFDAVVVGVPDDRWGQRVVAVVQSRAGDAPALEDLKDFCGSRIASYKMPRDLVLVEQVVRSPAGKADYPWARSHAMDALGIQA